MKAKRARFVAAIGLAAVALWERFEAIKEIEKENALSALIEKETIKGTDME